MRTSDRVTTSFPASAFVGHLLRNRLFFSSISVALLGVGLNLAGLIANLGAGAIFASSALTVAFSSLLLLTSVVRELSFGDTGLDRKIVGATLIYFLYTALLVIQFAGAWLCAGGFGLSSWMKPFSGGDAALIDAIYYTVTGFTTVGFGDYIPMTTLAKWFFSFEALIGVTHNVAFFSTIMIRVSTQESTGHAR